MGRQCERRLACGEPLEVTTARKATAAPRPGCCRTTAGEAHQREIRVVYAATRRPWPAQLPLVVDSVRAWAQGAFRWSVPVGLE
jgi:hypothetical protein